MPRAGDQPGYERGMMRLDPLGGIAGDMFVSAMFDLCPELLAQGQEVLGKLDLCRGADIELTAGRDHGLAGRRLSVHATEEPAGHVRWRDIRNELTRAALPDGVRDRALDIFSLLAEAEAAVHGVSQDEVSFHEVGAVDSIVDIVLAAFLIHEAGPTRWVCGALPIGSGRISSSHGALPVPAPATVHLLQGFLLFDDGEDGERITPTGAAILKHLRPAQTPDPTPHRLLATGVGLGTRQLTGRANMLRICRFGPVEAWARSDHVAILRCEIDDQSAEDLAVAVGRIRTANGVVDVCQWPVFGKKGRIGIALQVLAEPAEADCLASMIFEETTTLGVRHHLAPRTTARRVEVVEDGLRVKVAQRPSGPTAKAEIDDVAGIASRTQRIDLRRKAEQKALRHHGEKNE